MLFAGIAWTGNGIDVAVQDATGDAPQPPVHFPAGSLAAVTAHLRELDDQVAGELVCIVESTDGMVDGGLLASGLRVHRADPWMLPPRPDFGSVDAVTLARTGVARLTELPRLVLQEGSLTGRGNDHARAAQDCEPTLDSLVRKARCLTRGPHPDDEKVVALTFDDGPNPPWTTRILDVLARYDVPATFFCVGLHARGHPDLLTRMAESGHCLGNHTWSHPFLPDLSVRELGVQLERTDDAIEAGAGRREHRLFRPPYGSGTPELFSWVGAEPDTTMVLWDVDTQDWAMPGPEAIRGAAVEQARPGSILLMHDGGGDRSQTAEALPGIVEGLLERGFRFVRVDEMVSAS